MILNPASALAKPTSQVRFTAACGGISEHNKINNKRIDDGAVSKVHFLVILLYAFRLRQLVDRMTVFLDF